MGAIIATFLRVTCGMALAWIIDKFVPDPPVPKTGLSAFPMLRLIITAVVMTVGVLVVMFVGKKLGIKILKKQ